VRRGLPDVSFVIINYNYEAYVEKAISSVLSQDYTNFECLIIDNKSTDASRAVIQRFEHRDDRLSFTYLDSNLNQMGALLHVLDRLSGDLVCIVDADDFLFANYASFHVQLHIDCDVAATSSGVIEVDGDGHPLSQGFAWLRLENRQMVATRQDADLPVPDGPVVLNSGDRALLWRRSALFAANELGWHWSPGTANMYKRSALQRTRPALNVVNEAATDNYFMPFVHALGGSACVDIPLSGYRIHGQNRHGGQPSFPDLTTVSKTAASRSQTRRTDITLALASRARDFNATHGQSFWTMMDVAAAADSIARDDYFSAPAVQNILADHFAELTAACGEAKTKSELRKRMGAKAFTAFLLRLRRRRS
jgi:hypothetical protein